MLRGSLLAAALFVLLGSGGTAGHVRNGRIAYAHVGDGKGFQIYSMTAAGRHRRPLTTGHRYSSYDPAYAPRGKRIAFVRADKTSTDIWIMNADGTRKRALTRTAVGTEIDPAWSPDGKWIAFAVTDPPAQQGIWLRRADGTGAQVRVTTGDDASPTWSPDGTEIAFQRGDTATQVDRILVVPAGGGPTTPLSNDPGVSDLQPAWSPNGSKILFVSDRPDTVQLDLWVMNADGSNVRRVTNTPARDEGNPAWSPDGRWISYSGVGAFHGASSSQLYVSRPDGSNRHKLTHACGDCAWINDWPSWQPRR